MKKKLIFIPIVLATLFLQIISPAFAALRAEPIPRGSFQRDLYKTDLFTGSATYSYDIKVPKGTDDVTPTLSFSYNSAGVRDTVQRYGIGWELNQDYVERDINFTPSNINDDKYKLHFKGGVYDLVYVSSDGRYHTKIESNFNITKLTTTGTNEKGEYWQLITSDGTKYRFGQAYNSELVCNGRDYVSQWNLDQVTDIHDNKIYSTYTENNGVSYLSQIKYNNDQSRIIDFTYGANPYSRQLYLQGCDVTESSRLNNIQIKINTNLVRQYDLAYATAGNNQSLLQSITEKGNDGTSTLPATTFDYKSEVKTWQTSGVNWLEHADIDTHLNMTAVTFADVNGDGLVDIVRTIQNNTPNTTWKVLFNQGNNKWETSFGTPWIDNKPMEDARLDRSDVRLADVTGDNLPDIVMAAGADAWKVWRNTGSSWNTTYESWANLGSYGNEHYLGDARVFVMDVTGDGLADVVTGASNLWRVFRNMGDRWNGTPETWNTSISQAFNDPSVRVIDVNGDGLPDIVRETHNGSNVKWYVYKNNGNGWNSSSEPWISNENNLDAYFENNDTVLVDVNGDGLADIVRSFDNGLNDEWKVLLNQGSSWSTTYDIWIPSGANLDLDAHSDKVRMVDATGDGLVDIVQGSPDCSCSYDTWTVWKNNGGSPDLLAAVHTPQGGTISFDYKASTTFDNTGPDALSDLPFSLWLVDKKTENNGVTGVHATNDITSYTYQDGLYDWQDKEFRGFATVTETLPNTTKKQYVFKQDDSLKGRLDEVITRDSQSNPYAETENTWSSSTSNGVTTVNLSSEKNYTYDGTATNPKIVQTDYQYDTYGNVTKQSQLGDTSVTGDERYTYNEYIYNPALWIVDKVAHTTLKASDDTTELAQAWKYYDTNPTASSSAASSFGDGSTGDITIFTNTTETPIDSFVGATAGSTTATVGLGLGFATNQIVLLHQTQGTNAGTWEYARVQSYSGATLTLNNPLINSYSSSGSNHAQVRVVPQYHNVTVNSGATWMPKPWDGSTGGIMAFLANGTITVSGSISANNRGFRGSGGATPGVAGEGTTGVAVQQQAANGNAGGGATSDAANGGGGGNGTAGETPAYVPGHPSSGAGGGTAGTTDLSLMVFGGAGGTDFSPPSNSGNGGGIIFITSPSINVSGTITSFGAAGTATTYTGSGGGAGGSILLKTQNAILGSTLITALGGAGGAATADGGVNRTGGAGGAGRIRIQYETSLTGSTNPAASSVQSQIPLLPAPVAGSSGSGILTKGDLTKEVKWLSGGTNPETTYQYDSYGNQTSVTDANNHTTTQAYDTTGTYPVSQTNAKNQITTMSYDLGTGNLLSKTDPNNQTTSYTYDAFGRVTKEIKPGDTTTYPSTSYQYLLDGVAPEGTIVSKREVSGTTETLDVTTYTDGLGRILQSRTDAEDTSKQIVVDKFYDPTGEVLKQTVPYLDTLTTNYATPVAGIKVTEMTYDTLGRATIIKNPKGDSKTIAYDHWKETAIDEEGNIKRKYLNAFEKIAKVEEVNGATTYATNYTYNARDELTRITDHANNNFDFVYDTLGRKTSQTDPDMGTWTYVYDGVGNLTSQTDARNITTTKTYDELNRLTKNDYPTDTDTTFVYDTDKIGMLSVATDSAGMVSFQYDNRLRKKQEQRSVNGTTKTTQFTYDSLERIATQTYPDSEVLTYSFNTQGEINAASGATGILSNIDYNALGKITKKDYANGVTTNYTYNTDDFRLGRIQTGSLFDKNYSYDKVGNISSIINNLTSKTELFGYDDLDRLKTASESAGYNYGYEYNSIGNLTKFTDNGNSKEYLYGATTGVHALKGLTGETTPQPATNYSAEYFNNNNLSGTPALTRTDSIIDFNWGSGSPDGSIQNDNFSARWTKTINFEAGNYMFSTTTDDGVRLYIDNVLVIDSWIGQSSVTHTAAQTLSAGNHTIKMEYYEGGGGAVARFTYQKLTTDFTGEYYNNKTLSGAPTIVRNDPLVNFDWKTASPAANITRDNFSTRWTKVASFSAGIYQFTLKADDGIRLYVDDEQLINGWLNQSGVVYTTTKAMSEGNHRIRVEYYDDGWDAMAQFVYSQVSGPFSAEYFNNQTLSGSPVLTRNDPAVDFNWGGGSPDVSVSANQFSARWTKTQNFAAGTYDFGITGDDGIRLFIDNTQVINGWFDQGSVGYTTSQTLSAGNHTIKVEYYEGWVDAVAKLSMSTTSANFALNHTVASSSVENNDPNLVGGKAVDGNTSTRWSSSASDPQWIYVDLGSRKTFNRVKLNWHSNYGKDYDIQVSDDASNWTTVKSIWGGNGGIDDVTGFFGTGRYVRLYGTQRGTAGTYSLNEFEVYGDIAPSLPTPTNTPIYTYDQNGNMTSSGELCYEYNEANQLKKVTKCANNEIQAEYVYDYTGKRIIKKNYSGGVLANTVTSWTPSYETKMIVGGNTESTSYYYANGELVARKNNDGSKTYYHTDHLGSTSVLTNQAGSLVESTTYDPYGKVKTGGQQSRFQYTGKEKDQETGLNYYESRYYSSDIRRFVQPDTLLPDIYDPQQLNRYSYANNNPMRYTDPSGHVKFDKNGRIVSDYSALNTPQKKKTTSIVAANTRNTSTKQNSGNNSSMNNAPAYTSVLGNATHTPGYVSRDIKSDIINSLPKKGYIDVNVSTSLAGIYGANFGMQANQRGYAWYGGMGSTTKGAGGAITYSQGEIQPHSTTTSVSLNRFGGAGSGSMPFREGFVPFAEGDLAGGIGNPGQSSMVNQTFSFHEWNDRSGYKFIQTVE